MQYIYGIHAVDSLLRNNPKSIQRLWVQQGREDKRINSVVELAQNQGVPIAREPRKDLDERVNARHQGVVAETVDEQVHGDVSAANLWSEASLLHFVEQTTEPCLLSPTVRKVACGAADVVPFVRVTNLSRTLDALKERGVWLFGAAGEAEKSIYDNDLTGPMALVMGAEGAGLRRLTREHCDHLVKLPMAGSVSSLNVSVATGICLFEAVRQRAGQAPQDG